MPFEPKIEDNTEKKKDLVEKPADIDPEVLDIMSDEQILEAIKDDTQAKRLIVNAFAEMLSEFIKLRSQLDAISQTVSTLGYDKLTQFFAEVDKNFKNEEVKAKLQEKISQSHKKPQKSSKK